ncbi:hypothetical protein DDD63_04050 [Actinobaculum sp. 313]|nr:hypothetical protein DDD63_04050 [Actinobaculum sp. 313]
MVDTWSGVVRGSSLPPNGWDGTEGSITAHEAGGHKIESVFWTGSVHLLTSALPLFAFFSR